MSGNLISKPTGDSRLFKKIAKLKFNILWACEFPSVIKFDYGMKFDEK